MNMLNRTHCFGYPAEIWCACKGRQARFCPIHTPTRYGELCRSCYFGVLAAASGLQTLSVAV